ncbi:MAG: ATP-binding protein [Oscillospiraceae bacterium]|nr:ATP-binding protein [Oscillospiraceae bacterium]
MVRDGISTIYAALGLAKRTPINFLGDGINRLLHIALTMLTNQGSIILIDEIENGFHYSFYPKLWEVIEHLAEKTKCQVFATTHSYECISGARELAKNDELFRFIRLAKVDDEVVAKPFDSEGLEYALEHEWEVR